MLVHELSLRIGNGAGYFLWAAEAESQRLIVLCHGWHGHVTETWRELKKIYRNDAGFRGTDLLFIGYRKSPTSIDLLAAWLADYLVTVFPSLKLPHIARNYRELLLVGHSLGTLAIRQAVLQLYDRRTSDTKARQLCENAWQLLLAPPLLGVDWEQYLEAIRGEWTEWLLRIIGAFRKALEPVSSDLAVGSDFLEKLRRRTSAILCKGESGFPHAHVLLGSADRVIEVSDVTEFVYPGDTREVLLDKTHVSVCKVPLHDRGSRLLTLLMSGREAFLNLVLPASGE